eukprot:GHVS01078340.1.p2 GENE.GHVS01078340.1~~GHVS01078340.1.p2  ORF type:complete len:175 (-),score=11.19 GHVS01078340.1:1774-2298(-)
MASRFLEQFAGFNKAKHTSGERVYGFYGLALKTDQIPQPDETSPRNSSPTTQRASEANDTTYNAAITCEIPTSDATVTYSSTTNSTPSERCGPKKGRRILNLSTTQSRCISNPPTLNVNEVPVQSGRILEETFSTYDQQFGKHRHPDYPGFAICDSVTEKKATARYTSEKPLTS